MEYIYGKNTVMNAIIHRDNLLEVILCENFKDEKIKNEIKKSKVKCSIKSLKEITHLVGNVNHQGIIAAVKDFAYLNLEQLLEKVDGVNNPTIAILDGIEDPHNFGAIIRSADAFGIDGMIIAKNNQVKVNGTVAKVSTGATQYVPIAMVTNLNQTILTLKEKGFWIVASDGSATMDYRQVDYQMKTGLIIGSEGFGISKLLLRNSDFIVKIPMIGHVNSLNASVASALFFAQIHNSKHPIK